MRTLLERDLPLLGSNVPAEALRRFWPSWEGYAVEETLKAVQPEEAYFWATHQGAELDLLLFRRGGRFGVEIKRADAPLVTPSMRIALRDLKLEHLTVLYPGSRRYALGERITVVPVAAVAEGPDGIFPRRKAAPAKRRRG